MNIYTVTSAYHSYFASLFSEFGEVKILPKDYQKLSIDLLIFTGGEDVHPSYYGNNRTDGDWFNRQRDEIEFDVLKDIMRGKTKVNKVLGVCRGLQIINVAMGGTLTFDIAERYGTQHPPVHNLNWQVSNTFSELLPTVNSMHHQAIRRIGEAMHYQILALEPSTEVIEAIHWAEKFFAVQFHPEFFVYDSVDGLRTKFAASVIEWVKGNISVGTSGMGRRNRLFKFQEEASVAITNAAEAFNQLAVEYANDDESEEENF